MKNHTVLRWLLACGVGVVMFAVASGVAWFNMGSAFYNNSMLQLWTIVDIQEIDDAVAAYISKTNTVLSTVHLTK